MKLRVLGAAAGGGFPQWNCNCPNCAGVRSGTVRARRRTQSSIAVSGDDANWVLINASPDILHQIQAFPALQPARRLRDTGIAAIILVDGQIDHSTGLYFLREHTRPLEVWTTEAVRDDLSTGHPVFRLLEHFCGISWRLLPTDGQPFAIEAAPGLTFAALPLSSKPAPYSPHRADPQPGDNVGLSIRDAASGRAVFYAPGLGAIDPATWEAMRGADCTLVDGTFWREDEMAQLGISDKGARELGHLPQSGEGGMLDWLARLPDATRKVLIHINNTNPILDEDSAERAQVVAAGVEVAYDGLEIEL